MPITPYLANKGQQPITLFVFSLIANKQTPRRTLWGKVANKRFRVWLWAGERTKRVIASLNTTGALG